MVDQRQFGPKGCLVGLPEPGPYITPFIGQCLPPHEQPEMFARRKRTADCRWWRADQALDSSGLSRCDHVIVAGG